MKKPEYQGRALSTVRRISEAKGDVPTLWMWGPVWRWREPEENREHSLEAIGDLIGQGYTHWEHNNASIESQFGIITRLTKQLKNGETWLDTWYKPVERDILPPAPVVLTFSIEANPKETDIPMLNPLPLPQHGEYALVQDEQGFLIYSIMALPLEARQRWVTLGEALKKLSSPLLWPAFTDRHQIASNELLYNRELAKLNTQQSISLPGGKTRVEHLIKTAQLQAAHSHIKELSQQLEKETWLEEWEEISVIAHTLAWDYYTYHISRIMKQAEDAVVQEQIKMLNLETTETTPAPEEPTLQILDTPMPIDKKKRIRRPHAPATGIIAKGKDTVTVRSDTLNREIINALRDGGSYIMNKEQLTAEHSHPFSLQKSTGQIIITLRGLAGESFETILSAVNTLGDGCIDTFIAVQAIAIDKNGTDHIRTPIEMSPDDILEICGKKKSHGSYTPFQRAEVIAHLKTLSQAHVIATLPGRPARGKRDKGTTLKVEGALIDLLSWKIGEYNTITGEEIWERRSISVGQWVTMVPEMSDKTAIMLRRLLAYSAKNERYQKRLGLYLTFMFRINTTHGGAFDVTTEKLLEGSGVIPDRHRPGEFKSAIERALQCLKNDNIIGPYAKLIDVSPDAQEREKLIQQMGKGWFDLYLAQLWRFNAPDRSKEQYKQIKRPDPTD